MTTTTFKPSYTNASALTITLASLASTTADPPVGRESAAVDNTSTLALDFLISGQITTGTLPTASKQITVCFAAMAYDGTNSYWPAGITGSDAGLTPTFAGAATGIPGLIIPALIIPTNNSSNVNYKFTGLSLCRTLGLPVPPLKWSVFVFHNTGVNLNSTGGNHFIYATPINSQGV